MQSKIFPQNVFLTVSLINITSYLIFASGPIGRAHCWQGISQLVTFIGIVLLGKRKKKNQNKIYIYIFVVQNYWLFKRINKNKTRGPGYAGPIWTNLDHIRSYLTILVENGHKRIKTVENRWQQLKSDLNCFNQSKSVESRWKWIKIVENSWKRLTII